MPNAGIKMEMLEGHISFANLARKFKVGPTNKEYMRRVLYASVLVLSQVD